VGRGRGGGVGRGGSVSLRHWGQTRCAGMPSSDSLAHRRSGSLDTQLLQFFQPERLQVTVRTRASLVATMSATMRCII
jgi:hypothetical protein